MVATVPDFWQMVWENGVNSIVMLTGLIGAHGVGGF